MAVFENQPTPRRRLGILAHLLARNWAMAIVVSTLILVVGLLLYGLIRLNVVAAVAFALFMFPGGLRLLRAAVRAIQTYPASTSVEEVQGTIGRQDDGPVHWDWEAILGQPAAEPSTSPPVRRRGGGEGVRGTVGGQPDVVADWQHDTPTYSQRRILEFIKDYVKANGYPPSVREIAGAVGLATSSVRRSLNALESKGFIRRDPAKSRSIYVYGSQHSSLRDVPLVGHIAAGSPILADENVEARLPLPQELIGAGETFFMVRVRGDSMVDAGILDGDLVVVRSQSLAENGDMVAALIEDEATVKTFSRRGDSVQLLPANIAYKPIDATEARILGKVVAVIRRVT